MQVLEWKPGNFPPTPCRSWLSGKFFRDNSSFKELSRDDETEPIKVNLCDFNICRRDASSLSVVLECMLLQFVVELSLVSSC